MIRQKGASVGGGRYPKTAGSPGVFTTSILEAPHLPGTAVLDPLIISHIAFDTALNDQLPGAYPRNYYLLDPTMSIGTLLISYINIYLINLTNNMNLIAFLQFLICT